MKKYAKNISIILALVLCLSVLLAGCKKDIDNPNEESTTESKVESVTEELPAPDYADISLDEYVKLGEYVNMNFDLRELDISPDILVWEIVVSNAEIISYPEDAVAYYEQRSTKLYENYAEGIGITYDELLASVSMTQEDIVNEAKGYVKSDLVQLAIIEAEGLHLTDDEKSSLFDKYVDQFIDTYGFTDDYIRENLEKEIYDSMQYDKMMEFLLINNNVLTEE